MTEPIVITPKDKAQDLFLVYYERLPDFLYSNSAAKEEAYWMASQALALMIHYAAPYYKTFLDQVKIELDNIKQSQ